MSVSEEPSGQREEGAEASSGAQAESVGLPAGWTREDLLALADQVYELLLRDLLLERERGAL